MTIILRISRSQQMALLDIIMEHLRCPNYTEVFIDCSTSPPTETTISDLLNVVGRMDEMDLSETQRKEPNANRPREVR